VDKLPIITDDDYDRWVAGEEGRPINTPAGLKQQGVPDMMGRGMDITELASRLIEDGNDELLETTCFQSEVVGCKHFAFGAIWMYVILRSKLIHDALTRVEKATHDDKA
jgi:hypothetical protein